MERVTVHFQLFNSDEKRFLCDNKNNIPVLPAFDRLNLGWAFVGAVFLITNMT
ncbi:hypothetical protein KH400_03160 [Desertibacillus haloalkaliphilus]|nr:hypothetical protein [Desertibacillus haloalkaliphilus]